MMQYTSAKIDLLNEIIGIDKMKSQYKNDIDNINIYTCSQSLFKMHPNHFDVAVAEILHRDPKAHLVMIRGRQSHWTEMILKRLASQINQMEKQQRAAFVNEDDDDTIIIVKENNDENDDSSSEILNRIHFIRRRSHVGYLNMLLGSDVVLDTFPFGGGVSNLEALAVGTPVVTHPDIYLRGRLTLSFYRAMDMGSRFISYSLEEYINLAIKLASNTQEEKDQVRIDILNAKSKLFQSTLAIEEWERFFIYACRNLKLDGKRDIMKRYLNEPIRKW